MADIPEQVFSGAPHRLTMGLRRLDLTTWLDADPDHPQREYRRQLLAARRDEVYAVLPAGRSPAAEVAARVAEHVGRSLPGLDDPLVEAAGLVRDDVCVLTHDDGAWRLVAAVVCFPSRWRLADKMGRDVLDIHGPVPRYGEVLGGPTTKVFDSLTPRWRVNWTLLDDPELFQPDSPGGGQPPSRASFLRVERQCLVPVGEAVAFTIRTDVVAVTDLPADKADAVLAAAAATPAELADYRGWTAP
jgi:hypothetical protein